MSSAAFKVQLNWQPDNKAFTYNEYSRQYEISANGKPTLIGTAAPEYKGTEEDYNPEEYLIMALSACHMLSYLALTSNSKIQVLSYEDDAEGELMKDGNIIRFKEVTLRPKIQIASDSDYDKAVALHDKAHHVCFIANSVNFPVHVVPEIKG